MTESHLIVTGICIVNDKAQQQTNGPEADKGLRHSWH